MNGLNLVLKTSKNPALRCSLLKVNDSYLTLSKNSSSVTAKSANSQVSTKSSDSLPANAENLPVQKKKLSPFVGSTSVGEFITARSDDLVNWARKG